MRAATSSAPSTTGTTACGRSSAARSAGGRRRAARPPGVRGRDPAHRPRERAAARRAGAGRRSWRTASWSTWADGPGGSKRHLELALPDGMTYRCGDYLAVLPRNARGDRRARCAASVSRADTHRDPSRRPGGSATLPTDIPISAAEILSDYVELDAPATRAQIGQLAAATPLPAGKRGAERLRRAETYDAKSWTSASACSTCWSASRRASSALPRSSRCCRPLRARQYSISSSPLADESRPA